MKKLYTGLIILALVGLFLIYASLSYKSEDVVKTFSLTGENFKFTLDGVDNPDIVVNKGDTVRIEFKSVGGFHDWKVDEFGASTSQVRDTDGPTSVEFVADKTGSFRRRCRR
jgi:heme/copper-type cytochrome/quinol oxidase subunit 2